MNDRESRPEDRARGEYEYCVLCGRLTDVRRDEPVDRRIGYVEGCGQLCRECFLSLEGDRESRPSCTRR